MFKLPLDSLLTVAQPTPQLIEVQARFQYIHNIHDTQPPLPIPFTLQLSPIFFNHSLVQYLSAMQMPHTQKLQQQHISVAASGPAVLKSLGMSRCCCQTGVLASYAYKQAMQAAQLLSCITHLQRYFPHHLPSASTRVSANQLLCKVFSHVAIALCTCLTYQHQVHAI